MRIGKLKQSVTLQTRDTGQDAVGQRVDTYTTIATRRASVEPLNGREYFAASGEQSEVTTRIRMRYDSTVATLRPDDRIIDGSTVYDIRSVINPSEGNRELVFMARRDG